MNAILLSLCLSAEAAAQLQRVPPPSPEPPLPAPLPPGATIPPPPTQILPPRLPTFEEFLTTFVPVPGIHDVTIIHPVTKRPVNVVFRLPDYPLRKVYNSKTRITYNYGKTEVTLIFRLIGGKVDVRYD